MPVPRSQVLREVLLKKIPATVKVNDVDNITLDVEWLEELPEDATVKNPSVLVAMGDAADLTRSLNAFEFTAEINGTIIGETHVFTTGQDMVLDEMDVAGVTSVSGTRAGSPFTFLEGTHFTVEDTDGDGYDDALRFIAGQTPDNGTTVTSTYTHRLLEDSRSHLFQVPVVLHAVASPLAATERGATVAYRTWDILDGIQKMLIEWFEKDLRPALEAEGIILNLPISIGHAGAPPMARKGATNLKQQTYTFSVSYQEDVLLAQSRAVRKVTTNGEWDP